MLGDVDAGFRQASVIVEREVYTTTVHQGYIEPHNATAVYNPSGQITIWCSTQGLSGYARRSPTCWMSRCRTCA
ncbi:MAG: molybdopterin cofactor-binding domain-containing protein [Anaerolineae bacterium]